MYVAVTGVPVGLVSISLMDPVPLAVASLIPGTAVLVQEKVTLSIDDGVYPNDEPEHIDGAISGDVNAGTGLTAIMKELVAPTQPCEEPVTLIVANCIELPGFNAVNGAILPVPFKARPILELLFAQLKTAPATLLVKFSATVVFPAHRV